MAQRCSGSEFQISGPKLSSERIPAFSSLAWQPCSKTIPREERVNLGARQTTNLSKISDGTDCFE